MRGNSLAQDSVASDKHGHAPRFRGSLKDSGIFSLQFHKALKKCEQKQFISAKQADKGRNSRQLDYSYRFWKRMEKGFLCFSYGWGGAETRGPLSSGFRFEEAGDKVEVTAGFGGGHRRGNSEWGMVEGEPFLFYIPSALSLPSDSVVASSPSPASSMCHCSTSHNTC